MSLPPVPLDRKALQLGQTARGFGDPRDSNSYLEHRRPSAPDEFIEMLIAAWYRGWDEEDARLKGEGKT